MKWERTIQNKYVEPFPTFPMKIHDDSKHESQ